MTVYDSEDPSSPESEGEEEESDHTEEEKEENQEEIDSGSEVEIIQEVQGSGSQPPPVSTPPPPSVSEQEAAQFSLFPATVEMKVRTPSMENQVQYKNLPDFSRTSTVS